MMTRDTILETLRQAKANCARAALRTRRTRRYSAQLPAIKQQRTILIS